MVVNMDGLVRRAIGETAAHRRLQFTRYLDEAARTVGEGRRGGRTLVALGLVLGGHARNAFCLTAVAEVLCPSHVYSFPVRPRPGQGAAVRRRDAETGVQGVRDAADRVRRETRRPT